MRAKLTPLAAAAMLTVTFAASPTANAATNANGRAGAVVPIPAQSVNVAAQRTLRTDVAFSVDAGKDAVSGVRDADTAAMTFIHRDFATPVFVATSSALYQQGLDGMPQGSSVRMAVAEMAAACGYAVAADPMIGLSLLETAEGGQQTGLSFFTGTVNLSKVTGSVSTMKAVEYLSAITPDDHAPFSATVNGAGYVTSVTVTFMGTPEGDLVYNLRISEHGASKIVNAPVVNVIDAPDYMYG